MITVNDLVYTYPSAYAPTLKGLSFEIAEGDIFGFLGPSGSGKSTTQKLMFGLLKNYEGAIQIMGKEIRDWDTTYYEHVGVCFELPNHYLKLTARENLSYFASLYRGPTLDVMDALKMVDLHDHADKKVEDFSKGMKVRLNVARSIIHNPRLLFLDEPTSGLDPVNARKIKDLVLNLRDQGTTVFVTTHNMMVADELCDRVGFITNGVVQTIDSPKALKQQYGTRAVEVEYHDDDQRHKASFELDGLGQNADFLKLLQNSDNIETIHTQETTLEHIFIEVTGQELKA